MSDTPLAPPKRALGIIFLIVFMDLLGFGVIIPQLPFYARTYHASALQVTVLFSIYSICQFAAAPILGAISDRIGRRPVLIVSQIGSAIGYAMLAGVTQHEWANPAVGLWLIYVSRAIDGFSGGNISTAQAYISDVTTSENRAKGMGVLGAAFGIGFAAGPALGGLLGTEGYEFLPAYAAAIFSAIAAILTFFLLPESHHRIRARDVALTKTTLEQDIATPMNVPDAIDLSGPSPLKGERLGGGFRASDAESSTTSTAKNPSPQPSPLSGERGQDGALGSIVKETSGAVLRSAPAWMESEKLSLLERTGILAALKRPMLLQLLLLSFCSMAAFVMMESVVAIFLADTFGWGSRNVGYFFAFIGVIIAVVQGGLIGRLTRMVGEWPLAIAGPVLVAAGMACFAYVGFSPLLALLLLGAATNATGRSLQQPTVSSLISKFSDPREQGVVFGLYHGLSSVARVVGPIIAGLTYEKHHTAPFIVAFSIVILVAFWTALLHSKANRATKTAAAAT